MSTTAKTTAPKGKRYSPSEKQEIIDFVQSYNADKGRGGQSAASKKFGISQLTISSWLKSPAAEAAPAAAPAKRTRKVGPVKAPVAAKAPGTYSSKLNALVALGSEIDKAEGELAKLKAKFDSLKGSL